MALHLRVQVMLLLILVAADVAAETSATNCNTDIYHSSIAGILGKTAERSIREFGCPMPVMADCAYRSDRQINAITQHCLFTVPDGAVMSPRCVWADFTEEASFKVHKHRLRSAAKLSCPGNERIICAPDFTHRHWNCHTHVLEDKLPVPYRGTLPHGPRDRCAAGRILSEISEELSDILDPSCPQVASIVCPTLSDFNKGEETVHAGRLCRFGMNAAALIIRCAEQIRQNATMHIMAELQLATSQGCEAHKQLVCERYVGDQHGKMKSGWITCNFMEEGNTRGFYHHMQLPRDHVDL